MGTKGYVFIGSPLYIYGIIQTSTSELVYVGQTTTPDARFATHKSSTVKDIKDDCHMVIFDEGNHLTLQDEYFWIEHMAWLGCNLRNKRIRYTPSVYRYVEEGCVLPHLVHDIRSAGITIDQLAHMADISFSQTARIVHGGKTGYFNAAKICRVLKYGADVFNGLSCKRRRNLARGLTSLAQAKAYQRRIDKVKNSHLLKEA